MRIIIVRHGDPDYAVDSLTETGWKEAELLVPRLSKMNIKEFYLSPLGRAQATAKPTLEALGRTGITCDWLEEFTPRVCRPDRPEERRVAWDWLPQDWTQEEIFYQKDKWFTHPVFQEAKVGETYDRIVKNFDELLAKHGYVREGNYYRAERPNRDTIALICHFGLECVLLSHLLGISPMPLWHSTCAAPSSVTSIYTEERREGIACFRMGYFGDISHLYTAGEEPSFAARFCETYDRLDERHD